jgi:hypothetical protein
MTIVSCFAFSSQLVWNLGKLRLGFPGM